MSLSTPDGKVLTHDVGDIDGSRSGFKIPILALLVLGFGAIVVLASVAVFVVFDGGRETTIRLVKDRNERMVEAIVDRIDNHLDHARAQVQFLAQMVESGVLDPQDRAKLGHFMLGALGAAPQVTAITWVESDLIGRRVEKAGLQYRYVEESIAGFPGVRDGYERISKSSGYIWGDIIFNPTAREALANIRMPVRRDGVLLGVFASAVSVADLSRHMTDPEFGADSNTFILYGRNFVLGHPSLEKPRPEVNVDKPLLRIDEIDDPVLASIWAGNRERFRFNVFRGSETHVVEAEGRLWVFVTRYLEHYGDQPWIVGRYFPFDEVRDDTSRLFRALPFGAAALVLAIGVAILLGRAISRPISRLADGADRISRLDFDGDRLPPSHFSELDRANDAYNRSREALRIFGAYVPRKIVWRLMAQGEQGTHSRRRVISIIFTDIAGFTSLAENMDEADTAAFLNAHFELISACVEAEGGAIDKFIGDAVMATWGAVERQANHADRACRAAKAIAAAIKADNESRRNQGKLPIRLRIGVHSGPVIVGNIGASGRLNYTVVGDAVNTAQRLEDLGRRVAPDDEVVALVSGETMALTIERIDARHVGHLDIRGRQDGIDVFRLA